MRNFQSSPSSLHRLRDHSPARRAPEALQGVASAMTPPFRRTLDSAGTAGPDSPTVVHP